MTHVTDYKRDSMQTVLGSSVTNIDDLEKLYLAAAGATADQVNRAWHQVFLLNGATSANWNTAAQEFLLALGAPSSNLSDNWDWFWVTNGGVIGPSVQIVLNSGGSCTFVDPAISCSTAAGTYEANDSGFTNPADTWLWTIESGVATITGSATSKTVVVDTGDVEGEVAFTLKVVATDSVSTDTANTTIADSQTHTDISPPVFVGTVPSQTWLTTESSSLELEPYFSNPVGTLTFAITAGSLPTGMTLNTSTGEISGQPTVETTGTLTVSCTNAYGTDSTNSFGWESTAVTEFVVDTFTDTNGTVLSSHTPDTDTEGGGWSILSGSPDIQSNKCSEDASNTECIAIIDSGQSDAVITATGAFAKDGSGFSVSSGLVARITDAGNAWYFSTTTFSSSPWTWGIWEKDGGVYNLRASAQGSTGGVASINADMTITLNGTSIRFEVPSEGIDLSYTSSLHQSATNHGVRLYRANTIAANAELDNFKVI